MNWPTFIVAAMVAAAFAASVISMIKGQRQGRPGCGGNCPGCALKGGCHRQSGGPA